MALETPLVAVEDLPELMQRYLAAYHAHDAGALAALYAPHAVVSVPGAQMTGREEISAMWSAWFTALPDVESDVLRASQRPGEVVAEWEERGTQTGRLRFAGFNLPASGRRLCWRGATIYTWGTDGLESVTYYFDRLTLALQLGTARGLPGMTKSGLGLLRDARRKPR